METWSQQNFATGFSGNQYVNVDSQMVILYVSHRLLPMLSAQFPPNTGSESSPGISPTKLSDALLQAVPVL